MKEDLKYLIKTLLYTIAYGTAFMMSYKISGFETTVVVGITVIIINQSVKK